MENILYCLQVFVVYMVVLLAFGLEDGFKTVDSKNQKKENSKEKNGRSSFPPWWKSVFITVFFVWMVSGFIMWFFFGNDKGTAGDMFGAINALFSAFAFATLILTMWMQKEELAMQREELTENRKVMLLQQEEMALSRVEAESQTKAMEAQCKFMGEQVKTMQEQAVFLKNQLAVMMDTSRLESLNILIKSLREEIDVLVEEGILFCVKYVDGYFPPDERCKKILGELRQGKTDSLNSLQENGISNRYMPLNIERKKYENEIKKINEKLEKLSKELSA